MNARSLLMLLPLMALSGCVATETGNPQDAPDLDPAAVVVDPSSLWMDVALKLTGVPGAVNPAEGNIWVWDLDLTAPPTVAAVASDGSFDVDVATGTNHTLRLQPRSGDRWGAAVDLLVNAEGGVQSVLLQACLTFGPEQGFVRFDGSTEIVIHNGCVEAVERAPARLRIDAGLTLVDNGPTTLEAGAETSVAVSAHAGDAEDIVILDIVSPEVVTRAVIVAPR